MFGGKAYIPSIVMEGLDLPRSIVTAIVNNAWSRWPPHFSWPQHFDHSPSDKLELYSLSLMFSENRSWHRQHGAGYPEDLGARDPRFVPGEIDRKQSLIIGEFGTDVPIALDFRGSPSQPTVVYLDSVGQSAPGKPEMRWIKLHDSIDEFLRAIEINPKDASARRQLVYPADRKMRERIFKRGKQYKVIANPRPDLMDFTLGERLSFTGLIRTNTPDSFGKSRGEYAYEFTSSKGRQEFWWLNDLRPVSAWREIFKPTGLFS